MTEKKLQEVFSKKFGVTQEQSKEIIDFLVDTIVSSTFEDGKCSFGKVGTFKKTDVPAKPERLGVKNPLTGGTYDVPAKPARTKLSFALSKFGKTLGM